MTQGNNAVALRDIIRPLAIAPLAGLTVLTCWTLQHEGANAPLMFAPYLVLRFAPFCYGTALLFVLPIAAIRPSLRRPGCPVATIWGVLSAWAATAVVQWGVGQDLRAIVRGESLLLFALPGAASGLLYASAVRQRKPQEIRP
jgi:hypothetical protein